MYRAIPALQETWSTSPCGATDFSSLCSKLGLVCSSDSVIRFRAVATDFLSGPGTLFALRVDRGRDMGCLNQFGEAEVLLESGTAFIVDSVRPQASGSQSVLVVCMHEIPSDSLLFPIDNDEVACNENTAAGAPISDTSQL
eukprot:m51a1_g8198 hypothetical protein (141) ;mRNA; r:12218-16228